MATRGPEDRGTNTALVVVVVILVAALIGIFIWWGGNDEEVEIDLPEGEDIGMVGAASSAAGHTLPTGIHIPLA